MSTSQKIAWGLIVVGLAAVLVGVYFSFPRTSFGASPQGSTFQSGKIPGIAVKLSAPGANATSSSILNTSGQDYYITSLKIGCESVGTSRTAYSGGGLAALTLTVATSSTAAPATNSNTNDVGGGTITIATSTTQFTESTTTASGGNSNIYNIWPANTYLSFFTNATNTAACTFAADVLPS